MISNIISVATLLEQVDPGFFFVPLFFFLKGEMGHCRSFERFDCNIQCVQMSCFRCVFLCLVHSFFVLRMVRRNFDV